MKPDAVRIRRRAAGPVGEAAVHAIERLEPMARRGFGDHRREIAGMEASVAGHDAFFVGRETFDLPRRQEHVRKSQGHAPEDAADQARPPFGSIEVDNVRELVRERDAQPVVDVADEFRSRRPHGVQDDRVVGQGRRVAVGELGLIGEHDVRPARRVDAEGLPQRAPCLLGNRTEAARQLLLALVVINDEVLGRPHPEMQRRIEERRRVKRSSEQDGGGAGLTESCKMISDFE